MSWNSNNNTGKTVTIEGKVVNGITSTDELTNAIQEHATELQLSRFNVYMNGNKIVDPSDLDFEDVENNANFSVTPFDKNSL